MKRCGRRTWLVLLALLVVSSSVYAQGSIAGVVKDTSGAVLPGVTVEAASPALIEKTRSIVSDGTGQYRIENLRPGTYTVTYTLAGFNTVKRDGIELTGDFTATVNAELRVGALEETVTVTGETPIVDVQGTTRQRVMDHAVIDTIPAGHGNQGIYALAALIPGASPAGSGQLQDVGGSSNAASVNLAIHGSLGIDTKLTQNGLPLGEVSGPGFQSRVGINLAGTKETTIDTSAVSAEQATGGVRINLIPRDGGNRYEGTFYGTFANSSLQGDNLTQALKDAGLAPTTIKKTWDTNPGAGGPLRKDTVWFYLSAMYNGTSTYAGIYENLNANKPTIWTYAPDLSRPASNDAIWRDGQVRVTWQATPKHKIGLMWHEEVNCYCPTGISPTTAPDGNVSQRFPVERHIEGDWTVPITSRLLVEGAALKGRNTTISDPNPGTNPAMISVTEQSTGLKYRSGDLGYRAGPNQGLRERAAVSYITGAHAFKVGFNHSRGSIVNYVNTVNPVTYRFNNGVPNQITEAAYPYHYQTDLDHDLGWFAQDKWTVHRLTASYGVRFDWFNLSYPEQHLGPTRFTPGRDLTFPARDSVLSLKDLTPKLGVAYDLFGTGKTALKVTLNKYLLGLGTNNLGALTNAVNQIVVLTTRSWADRNGNFIPDCDLTNPAAQTVAGGDICGAMAQSDFGTARPGAAFDPEILSGWGHRFSNWEFSTGVQHELLPRVSVDVGYFRRWYGNFAATDNTLVGPSDYTTYSITAPVDPRLPGGGGDVITGLVDVNPNKFGQVSNFVTFADRFGKMTDHWNGIDITVNARPKNGVVVQGGMSTGRKTTDFCDVVAKLPEVLIGVPGAFPIGTLPTVGFQSGNGVITPAQFCHESTGFVTQVKALSSYTIPKVDVLVSAAFQNVPGPVITASYVATNAVVSPGLGRTLSGNAANVTVNIVSPGSLYSDRINQLDLRFGKVLRLNKTRTVVNLDLYNGLNGHAALTVNNSFAVWQQPTAILPARLAKIGVQFDF